MLLVSGWLAVSQTIIPDAQEHFLTASTRRDTHIFGGLGLKRNGAGFRQFVSERPDWFLDAPGQYRQEIDHTGIFIPTGGARQSIIKVCHEILAEFGYPKESFEIQMNGD